MSRAHFPAGNRLRRSSGAGCKGGSTMRLDALCSTIAKRCPTPSHRRDGEASRSADKTARAHARRCGAASAARYAELWCSHRCASPLFAFVGNIRDTAEYPQFYRLRIWREARVSHRRLKLGAQNDTHMCQGCPSFPDALIRSARSKSKSVFPATYLSDHPVVIVVLFGAWRGVLTASG